MAFANMITIHPEDPDEAAAASGCAPSACSACGQALAGESACYTPLGEDCLATVLSGPADQLKRVLDALGQRLGFAPDRPELGGVRGLQIDGDEVVLRLALPTDGSAPARAEAAWDTLRALLPDTDIYVNPAAA